MASSSSSNSSCFHDVPETEYDVFISFRGEDIRSSFLSHLVKELHDNQIDAYVDERLRSGDDISSALLQAIQESSISLVIFSRHYASSKWCLDELEKIIECMQRHQRIVIPVFFHVDPSDVRYQKRTFEEAFNKHQDKLKENMVKVQSWRSALNKAANLSGFHFPSQKYKNESELVTEIIKDISEKLCDMFSNETKGLVGIDKHFEHIESLLDIESREVRILGIWGMGGIGKTTIAEVVFDKYSSHYQGCCFLKNVREESEKHGLPYLFQKLVSQLLQGVNILWEGLSKAQLTNAKRRLSRKKVFIILDDLNTSQQLEHLIGKQICLGPGSRVIVTTRDKQILTRVHGIYEVQGLNFENSLQLFCLNAFSKILPEIGYEKKSKIVVGYANGNPLALKVLGSFLRSRNIEAWESALRKLKFHPDMDIFYVLKLSYDALDDFERNIFLDIAFFLKGKDKDDATRLLDSCGFFAAIGIDNLQRKALITISKDNKIEMHDLIEQMGWEIVRQESVKDPSKRSRLRNPEDVFDVLKNNKGTSLVEGIMLDLSQTRDLCLHGDTFKKMHKLRFLRFYTSLSEESGNVYIPTELESFSDELRYLEWSGYALNSLPLTFCPEKLVELHMPNSQVSKLWDGVQDLANLKEINLQGCQKLVELPDFTKASNLKKINLHSCNSLCYVHSSILCIHTLEFLDVQYCKKLKILKGEIHLKSLEYLQVFGCSSLEEFSMSSEEITELKLFKTKIDMLHTSIGRLSKLKRLSLTSMRLRSLPNEICLLTSLESLLIVGCQQLTKLPHNIKCLSRLTVLGIEDCRGLQSLPELPPSLTFLNVINCISLHTIFGTSLQTLFNMKTLVDSHVMQSSFTNCKKLDERSLYCIMEYAHDTLVRTALCDFLMYGTSLYEEEGIYIGLNGTFWYPGSKVPEWFKYQTRQASITVELDQPNQILGFFLCCVIPQTFPYEVILPQYYLGDGEKNKCTKKLETIVVYNRPLNSDHVCIWYDNHRQILDRIAKCGVDEHCTTDNQKISLEFIGKSLQSSEEVEGETVAEEDEEEDYSDNYSEFKDGDEDEYEEEDRFVDRFIKGCGIYPIYVSDIQNFIQKVDMELEFNDEDEYKEDRELLLNKFQLKDLEFVSERENASFKVRNLIIDPTAIETSWKQNDTHGENTNEDDTDDEEEIW